VRSEGTVLATVLLRVIRIAVLASSQALSLVGPHRDSDRSGYLGPTFSFIRVLRLSAEDLRRSVKT
jgi:hypothetical protein